MAETPTFPYGYTPDADGVQGMGAMLTMAEVEAKETVRNLHPEEWRRFKALMEFAYTEGVPLGVGTGWRVQPNPPPPGFAQPGNSWHESCPVSPTSSSALAIDTVPDISWAWMEANLGIYGLRSFRDVNDEPWHVQPIEAPASRSYATVLPPLEYWPLPNEEDDMPLTDEDIEKVAARTAELVWTHEIDTTGKDAGIEPRPARYLLQRTMLIVREYLGGFPGRPPRDPTMLKDIHDEVTRAG